MLKRCLLALCLLLPPSFLAAQAGTPAPNASHTLRPGDMLKVVVWGHEEFSGQFVVDETGTLQYPVIGDVDVRALSVHDLRERLRQGLEVLYKSPYITVTPLFRMAVLGHVRVPGLYTVDPTLSVLDVVAMAGGPAPGANMNKIRLLRGGSEMSLSFSKGGSLQEMGVRSGDQIVVPKKAFTREDLGLVLNVASLGLTVVILVNTLGQ